MITVQKAWELRGTILRRRFGHGRAAFDMVVCVDIEMGPQVRSATGTILPMSAIDAQRTPWRGPSNRSDERVDLQRLDESAWAPVFQSRIRQRSRSR